MADSSERVGVELYLDLTTYNRQVADAVASAGEVEAAWKASLGNIGGDLSLKVNVDMGDLGSVRQSLADLSENTGIKILTDDAELVAAKGLVDKIGAATPGVKVNTDDSELDTAKGKVDDIDSAAPNVKVKGDDSGIAQVLSRVEGKLNDIHGLAKIDLLLNLPANIDALAQRLLDLPIISTLNDIDVAQQRVLGRTGKDIPNAGRIIDNIYTNAWGSSREEIADLLIETSRLGVANEDLEATLLAVYQATDVTGGDTIETLRAMEQLVANGIVPSFQDAGDLLAFGFQNGLDQGGDFLDTLIEYAPQFKEAGLSMETMFNILKQGADDGVFNLDKVADGFKEMANLTREEVTALTEFGTATDRTTALEEIGFLDEAQAFASGKLSGDEYVAGLLDALRAIEDPAQQGLLTKYIFGPTQAEEITVSTLLGIDLNEELPAEMEGAAEAGSNAFNNTIKTGVTELSRTVESEITKAVNAAFNIDAIIDDWKAKIAAFSDEIQAGSGLLDAIEIGFELPGFADSVHRFEASIGEFAIGVLELIAGVQDFLGKDSSGTRSQIAGLAEGQLAFNIKVANPDEIQGEIDRAVSRGVSPDAIRTALTTAGQELIDAGDIERAQQIVDTFSEVQYAIAPGLDQIKTVAAEIALREIDAGTFTQEMIDNAVGEGFIVPVEIDETGLQEQLTQLQTWEDAFAQIQQSAQADSPVANLLENIGITSETVTEQEGLFGRLTEAGRQTLGMDIPESADTAAQSVEDADRRIASAMTGNTMTTSFETVEQVAASTMARVAESVGSAVKIAVAAEVAFTNQTNILKGALLGLIGEAGPGILALAQNLQNVASGASIAAQTFSAATSAAAAAGAAGGISEFASGGEAAGVFSVGEQGRELVVSGEPVSVLNNRSTNAIFNAIRSAAFGLAGGGGGAVSGGGNRNTFNFYTQSDAQAVLVGREVSRNLRGQ